MQKRHNSNVPWLKCGRRQLSMKLTFCTKIGGSYIVFLISSVLFYNANLLLFFSSYCIVCDYAQNLELPHFGAEQPQDIYYFSAITVNIFGIADATKKPTTMLAYSYTEDQGGKGGNNVASLIVKALRELGWIREDGSTGKQFVHHLGQLRWTKQE